nr:hypothetical protein [Flavobacterium sp. MC2016-06]MBU3861962.1 hypothetical protein [Flavobacterium sp. MC2016-06]
MKKTILLLTILLLTILLLTILLLTILLLISCKEETTKSKSNEIQNALINEKVHIVNSDSLISKPVLKSEENIFFGDSILAKKNYFENLNGNKGYQRLKNQNDSYQSKYSNFGNNVTPEIISIGHLKLKFEKQFLEGKKYRIILYTFLDDKKKDSLEFYRNVSDLKNEPSNYTSLSYLNFKDKKIWQIKYFSSPIDNYVGFILYNKNTIKENGKIEIDSIYYLDESLDVEMEKNKLYFN